MHYGEGIKLNKPWTKQDHQIMFDLYPLTPTQDIATKLGRSITAVRIHARRIGLRKIVTSPKISTPSWYWKEDEIAIMREMYAETPTSVIARRLGKTVSAVIDKASKLGIRKIGHPGFIYPDHLRKYSIRPDFFANLTPQGAYVMGFILADGSIRDGKLKISNANPTILGTIRDVLESNHPIYKNQRDKHVWYDLMICHTATVSDLVKWGITPAKSLTATLPPVPPHLFWHLVRGYFDGDGAIRYTYRGGLQLKFTSGSKTLLEQLAECIATKLALPAKSIATDKGRANAHRLHYCGATALAIGDAMYSDAESLYIHQKHTIFDTYRNRRSP
jgi:hypothetical protein